MAVVGDLNSYYLQTDVPSEKKGYIRRLVLVGFSTVIVCALVYEVYSTGKLETLSKKDTSPRTVGIQKYALFTLHNDTCIYDPVEKSFIWDLVQNGTSDLAIDKRIDNVVMEPIKTLPQYGSPCWYESLCSASTYQNQSYTSAINHPHPKKKINLMFVRNSIVYYKRLSKTSCNWRLRCLPAFYVLGVQKSGTDFLWKNILDHPHVFGGRGSKIPFKEYQYWNFIRYAGNRLAAEYDYNQRVTPPIPLRDYADLFDYYAEQVRTLTVVRNGTYLRPTLIGDGSASTLTLFPDWTNVTANRGLSEPKYIVGHLIKSVTPRVKLLIILRNPVDRLYSEYLWKTGERANSKIFHEICSRAIRNWHGCLAEYTLRHCVYDKHAIESSPPIYLTNSVYFPYVRDWMRIFDTNQLMILRAEDYYSNTSDINRKIYAFLGLEPHKSRQAGKHINSSPVKKKLPELRYMLSSTRAMLTEFFEPYNKMLAELLKDTRFMW